MADELIDIFDENNNSLNKTLMKSIAHKNGNWHRVAHIWIYNSYGEMLLQHRNKDKVVYPDLWDIGAAGHIPAGETPVEGAIRETEEEIGLKITKEQLEFIKIRTLNIKFENITNREFAYVYLLKFEGKIEDLKPQKEELQDLKFVHISQIKKEINSKNHKYVPQKDYWSEMIEIIENKLK